jgi:hypothetical protein
MHSLDFTANCLRTFTLQGWWAMVEEAIPLVMLEILNGSLMSFCGLPGTEGAKVAPMARLGILLARVQPVLSGLQFPYHETPITYCS